MHGGRCQLIGDHMPRIDRRSLLAGSVGLPLTTISAVHNRIAAEPNWRLRPTVHSGERWPLSHRMTHHGVPGVAVAVIRDGRVDDVQGFGTCVAGTTAPVGSETLFSVGSVSKLATAALCLRLVARDVLDLDTDVNRWLKRWRAPAGPSGDDSAVTLRMLLSHTGGFNVHGFEDYLPDAVLPTLVQTLRGEPPAPNTPLTRVDPAGARFRYSGGGYTVVQAVIEDATAETFALIAQRELFDPLNMERSQFVASPAADTANIAHAHDGQGNPVALPRGWQSFPELAASGLWTTAGDLARLIVALGDSYRRSNGFWPQDLSVDMMTAVSPGINGLGPRLAGHGQSRIFHHAGANDSYKAYVEGNLSSGEGLIVLTNGANGDVLGDEIRNAVSDAEHWVGDWSVKTAPVPPIASLLDDYVGAFRRREGQDATVTGFLDTGFSADKIEVLKSGEGLQLSARGRVRTLKPIDTSTFVMPDGYVPAAVLLFNFDRNAKGVVEGFRAIAGSDVLVFDRVTELE